MKALRDPLSNAVLAAASIGIVASVAAYCLVYTSLSGGSESIGEAASWAMINVLPWFLAFEAAKRAPSLRFRIAALTAALAVSLLMHVLLWGSPAEPGLELVRRLPALLLVGTLLGLGQLAGAEKQLAREIPLLPRQIDWVAAAGNYVELHGSGRTIVHRSSLRAVEADLAGHGFVRIHRSILVRRAAIARVRPNDVLLADGTNLATGKRYRATLH